MLPKNRLAVLVACVALGGCRVHEAELDAVQAAVDRQLQEKKDLAESLDERRREMNRLEQRLADALAALPEGADAGVGEASTRPAAKAPTLPAMPEPSWFEGSDGARKREHITDARRRIAELEREISEGNSIERRQRQVEDQLKRIDALRKAQAPR